MIGQTISLTYLVPMAVEVLEAEPLAEGDYYPRDLLASVLRVDESFWANHNELFQRIVAVLVRLKSLPPPLDEVNMVRDILKQASESFRPFLS